MQMLPIGRPKHHATARGQHTFGLLGQLVNNRLLDIPKLRLPFPLKILTDGAAELLLNDVVRVEEGKLQPSGELSPDGGFARAGEADEGDHT